MPSILSQPDNSFYWIYLNKTICVFALHYIRTHTLFIILVGLCWTSCNFDDINFEPPAPVAEKATNITSSSFTASWNPIVGAEEYVLQISTNSTFSSETPGEVSQTIVRGTSYQKEGLEASQVYYYRVRAVVDDQQRDNVYSNIIELETLALPVPVALDPSDIKPLRFTAHWQPVPGVEGYLLYVATDANFASPLEDYNGVAVADTFLLVEGLTLNQKYFYHVRSQRGTAQSDYSNIIDLITTELEQPQTLEPTEITYVSFTINWKPVEDASAYWVFVSTDPAVKTSELLPNMPKEESAKSTSSTIVGLKAGTTYYYRVQALNEKAPSEKSVIASVTTQALPPPVAQAASAIQVDAFQANWDSVENAASYFIDVARDAGFNDYVNGFRSKEVLDTFIVVPNLLNTTYYYRVRAKGFGSVSDNSNTIEVKTASFAGPEALSALEVNTNSFKAVWKKLDNIDSYYLEVATDINFDNKLPNYDGVAVSDTFKIVSGLINNKNYYYRVRASKGSLFSGYSDIINQTTTDLTKPTTLASNNITVTSFVAEWNTVSGASGYLVDVSSDPLFSTIFNDYNAREVTAPTTSLLVEDLDANTTYYYRVRAKNSVSTSENSDVRSVKTNAIMAPTAGAASAITMESFQANWEEVTNAESYLLDVSYDANFQSMVPGFNGRQLEGATTIAALVDGLEPSKTYYYRVAAKGFNSTSNYSVTVTVNTEPLPPPVVKAAENQETYAFTAQWEEVESAFTYLLYVATDPGFASILPNYNGREILGTSAVVSGLDPFTTYYYRLQSKRGTTLSAFSVNTIVVDPCISANCQIASRTFSNWRKESYTYTSDGLMNTITLANIAGNDAIRQTEIDYIDGGDQIEQATVRIRNSSGSLVDRELWTYSYNADGRVGKIDIDTLGTLPLIDLSMTFSYVDDKIKEVSFYNSSNTLIKTEVYSYDTQKEVKEIKVGGSTIKQFVYGNEFNTNSLLPQDVALLLFDPTGGAPNAFIPNKIPTYYQYVDDSGTQQSYSFVYQYNEKRIPVKILGGNGIPEMTYDFYGKCIKP